MFPALMKRVGIGYACYEHWPDPNDSETMIVSMRGKRRWEIQGSRSADRGFRTH